MKQLNVRDETHLLGKVLSAKSGKSLLDVVEEALRLYNKKLEADESESDLLQRAASVIDERMCRIVHEEVVSAMDEVTRLQEEMREQQAKELNRLLLEATPEAPADDLKEVAYEEMYGKGRDVSDEDQG